MTRARWWRDLTLWLTMAFAAIFAAVYYTTPPGKIAPWRDIVMVLSACFLLYAVISIPIVQQGHLRDIRLRRGEGVRARWIIPPSEWAIFVASERANASNKTILQNLVDLDQRIPETGVDIIVANYAVVVGNDMHYYSSSLSGNPGPFWIGSTPPTLEYRVAVREPDDTIEDRAIRFPVVESALAQARQLVN